MAFFPRQFYRPEVTTSFTPLLRLLDDVDTYSRPHAPGGRGPYSFRRTGSPQLQPKFDVREVSDVFEVHGELPGVNKDDVQIEFTEPQTMVIRGKVERTYTVGTSPYGGAPVQDEDTTMTGTAAATENDDAQSKSSYQATVEDEADSDAHESAFEEIENPEKQVEKTAEEKPVEEKPVDKKPPVDNAKYWLAERSIGKFARAFNFPSRVDQDSVTASFQNGILSVTVPKAKKHESRRITVN